MAISNEYCTERDTILLVHHPLLSTQRAIRNNNQHNGMETNITTTVYLGSVHYAVLQMIYNVTTKHFQWNNTKHLFMLMDSIELDAYHNLSKDLYHMMTSSNGNIFRVTGHLCGEFTGPGEFPTQRPVTRSFDVFFDLRLNKRLSKPPWGWWFETLAWSLWRHCNEIPRHIRALLLDVKTRKDKSKR